MTTTATPPASGTQAPAAAPSNSPPVPSLPPPTPRYIAPLAIRRFTVDEYHRLIAQGFFASDDRFELLEGYIVRKMPRDPDHDLTIELTQEAILARLPPGWRLRVQLAITTADSEPEPDFAVVRGRPQDRLGRHPGPSDLALLVEVSNTSLADDRGWKGAVYARAGVPVYWVVSVIDRRVEVYTDPSGPDTAPAYRRRQDYGLGQSIPLVIDGVDRGPVPVRDLFP